MSHPSSANSPPLPGPANDDRVVAGVAIDVDTRGETPLFLIQLLSPDLSPIETVASTNDEIAARRAWRLLARVLHRPCFVAKAGGGYRAIERMTGPITGREPLARRGRRVPLRRRHLSRRQVALPAAVAVSRNA